MAERRVPGLDREQITAAAVELLDEVGLEAISTRRLAAALGVRAPTLYWHVRNKDELLDLVAEAICADAFAIDETAPWREQLTSGLHQFRRLVSSHRDAATLLRRRPPTGPHRLRHIETTMRILSAAGLPESEIGGVTALLAAHVLNSVAEEQPVIGAARAAADSEEWPTLRRVGPAMPRSAEDSFELGIQILLDGIAARLAG
ncbi:TetR/AcrR family transcriptional regulator C-terminal domain-containing protein [Microlunatus soli]|uniref:Transcriptional regulator, TetR family n=1 Tax=Microlunatus soli TaxID=630515 RepID=A0A1H1U8R2_9ACTN|nr:TetR/AcrR family transcriptional regulator C-terminal domain-containing protein [Microlunatus soli]SDS68888.1 transcriptional regulator, TetR family [Microlunatus soli]